MNNSHQIDFSGGRNLVARERRYSVYLRGLIGRAGCRNRMPLTVRNISAHGLKGECAYPPRPDDEIEVELPGIGAITGHVRWGDGIGIGVVFDGPIDPTLAFTRNRPGVRRSGLLAAH
jgi:PilZ domain